MGILNKRSHLQQCSETDFGLRTHKKALLHQTYNSDSNGYDYIA